MEETPPFLADSGLPPGFLVGAATSSWQVEGSLSSRGRSIWDDFAAVPGAIAGGVTGEPACDHVQRMEQDLDLIEWLGLDAYRFSISWPRVVPDGSGPADPAGIDFYDRLTDGLLERGIRPFATLYHWDLPSRLQERGGWVNRATAEHFADYSAVLADRLGDRVAAWATLNEPWCAAFLGHCSGLHAPGITDPGGSLKAAFHLLLGHGLAAERLAAVPGPLGVVLNVIPTTATGPGWEASAYHADLLQNHLFLAALAGHGLPDRVVEATAELTDWSFVGTGDMQVIARPLDWIGENYYTTQRVGPPRPGRMPDSLSFPGARPWSFHPRPPVTLMEWEVEPSGLLDALKTIAAYLPDARLHVSENGAAVIDDEQRCSYIDRHLAATLRGRREGLPIDGYFVWSLMDNVEWTHGWTRPFGLVAVNPDDGTRTPRRSALRLRRTLALRSGPSPDAPSDPDRPEPDPGLSSGGAGPDNGGVEGEASRR